MNKPLPVELTIAVGPSVALVVNEINEACNDLGWLLVQPVSQDQNLFKANLGSREVPECDPSDPNHPRWHIATVTVGTVGYGKAFLRIVPNDKKTDIETPFNAICSAILSRLESVGIYNPPPPEQPKRPIGFPIGGH